MDSEILNISPRILYLRTKAACSGVNDSEEAVEQAATRKLVCDGQLLLLEGKEQEAQMCLRAAAEFGDNAFAQHVLARYYENAAHARRLSRNNDQYLAAMYWYYRSWRSGIAGDYAHLKKLAKRFHKPLLGKHLSDVAYILASHCESGEGYIATDPQGEKDWLLFAGAERI